MPSYQAQEVQVNGHTVKVATNMEIRPGYSPYIGENGNWYVYDITVKAFVDTGVSAAGGSGLTENTKQTLLACFQNTAWIDTDGQSYYNALYSALYPPAGLSFISAVYTQSGTVYDTDNINVLKTDLVVTAHYDDESTQVVTDYALSGLLNVGTSTVTVLYGGKTATFTVIVTEKPKAWYTGVPLNIGTVEEGSINGTTGANTESTTWSRTGMIDIEGAHLIQSREVSSKASTGNNVAFFFYDTDGDFISSKSFSSSTNKFTISTIPESTKYVRISAANDYIASGGSSVSEFVPYARPTVPFARGATTIDSTTYTEGNMNTATGNVGSGSSAVSQFIPLYGVQSFTFKDDANESASTYANMAFYDKDQNFMGCVRSVGLSGFPGTAIPYDECAYIRLYPLTQRHSYTVTMA